MEAAAARAVVVANRRSVDEAAGVVEIPNPWPRSTNGSPCFRRRPATVLAEIHRIQPGRYSDDLRDVSMHQPPDGTGVFALAARDTTELLHRVRDGRWNLGNRLPGLYLESLLPWQTDVSSPEAHGEFIGLSWSMFGLEMAAKGYNDNFVAEIACGACGRTWHDGLRYQASTVCRCPHCGKKNAVSTSNIKVHML